MTYPNDEADITNGDDPLQGSEDDTLDYSEEEGEEGEADATDPTEELQAKIAELEKQNKTLYAQRKHNKEKAEKAKSNASVSYGDVRDMQLAATKGLSDDEFKEVQTGAKVLGVSFKEALDNDWVMAKIESSREKQSTAKAANVKGGKRRQRTRSESEVLNDFNNGKQPETQAEYDALFDARRKE